MSWTKEEMDQAVEQVSEKARTDEAFREELLKDPNAAISKLIGKEIPESYKIRVIDQDPAYSATFVLPPMENELTDAELDQVAGGKCTGNICGAEVCAAKISGK